VLRLIFLCLVVLLPLGAALNYAGYCLDNGHVLTDSEKIRITVGYLLSRQRPFREDQKAKKFSNFKADLETKVDEFLAQNPGCCRMGPEERDGVREPTLWRRLMGSISGIVVIEGDGLYSMNVRRGQFAVSNCGRVW
jgi:hypothetical protein